MTRSVRVFCADLLALLCLLSTPYMLWKGVSVISNTSHPMMVVLSESMAPAFHRGDVILLWNRTDAVRVGQIPVCWFAGEPMPMVHRTIRVHYAARPGDGKITQYFLTKGDNNAMSDESLYPEGYDYASRDQVIGWVKGYIPYAGWLAISLQDWRGAKLAALGSRGGQSRD